MMLINRFYAPNTTNTVISPIFLLFLHVIIIIVEININWTCKQMLNATHVRMSGWIAVYLRVIYTNV